jgi:hypothetical protein
MTETRRADVVPNCPICGFTMKWWFAKWKCFNCGQWNGCCGDSTGDPGGLWSEPCPTGERGNGQERDK